MKMQRPSSFGVERNAADGGLRGLLDGNLGLDGAVPVCRDEAALLVERLDELVPRVDTRDHRRAEVDCLAEDVLLYLVHEGYDAVSRDPPRQSPWEVSRRASSMVPFSRSRGPMARRTGTLELILGELEAERTLSRVDLDADAVRAQVGGDGLQLLGRRSCSAPL